MKIIKDTKMKKTTLLFILLLISISIYSQKIYSKAYGNPSNKTIIYLHGGPGYNSTGFEKITAKKLSQNGFYVIVYDRRGEGRSIDKNALFKFKESFDDLNAIYKKFNIKSASLIGHSFGGIVATLYAEKHPEKINTLLLVGTPITMQKTFLTIINSSKQIYIRNKDSLNLKYIQQLQKMDTTSIAYSSYSFKHAMLNGFYYPKQITKEAINLYSKFKTDSLLIKHGSKMTYEAVKGFWKNEKYTTLDITENLKQVLGNKTLVFGLYGKDDGLFSKNQITKIRHLIGNHNFKYINNCSHNSFIDQRSLFIKTLTKWIN